ncbi:MAG TPA: DinB family protein [Chitinophagaceae bacterium]|nr:DinB family protein [Chitinophagaceae bacterium]
MPLKDAFIAELKHETALTKKILERVPIDQKDWKPHEKSMSIGRLATHIAETIAWVSTIRNIDDFDFMARPFKSHVAASTEELLQIFQTNLDNAIADLSAMEDGDFEKIWTVRRGEQVVYQLPKKVAVRGWAFNHQFHHRGQLSVYLRLLNVPVPGMYGPSADER